MPAYELFDASSIVLANEPHGWYRRNAVPPGYDTLTRTPTIGSEWRCRDGCYRAQTVLEIGVNQVRLE